MAEEQKKKKLANNVVLTGYLKENNLEKIVNKSGIDVIRGSIIIATDEINAHKVQFYVAATTTNGEPSKDFAKLEEILPGRTTTVASVLKEDPTADFTTALNAATKVYATARFDEYALKEENGEERSVVSLKGFRAGPKTISDGVFKPRAEFTADIFINDLKEEEGGTGRIVIDGLMPKYDKSVQKVEFIAPVEDGIADYIKGHYHITNTVTLKGDLINTAEKILKEDNSSSFFGRSDGPQYETKFVRERIIRGGSATPICNGEEGSITTAAVKAGLAERALRMSQNAAKAAERGQSQSRGFSDRKPAAKPSASSGRVFGPIDDDVDF